MNVFSRGMHEIDMKLHSACFLIAFAAGAAGQQVNSLSSSDKAAGWALLFDGRSMDGWEANDAWVVEDGCLKALAHPRVRRDLFTEGNYRNFELVFDWRISPQGNSGVKYRIQDRFFVEDHPAPPAPKRFEDLANYRMANRIEEPPGHGQQYVIGFEYQVIDNSVFAPGQKTLQRAGDLYDMAGGSGVDPKPVGEWNHSRIVLRGDHVEHWLNGVKVVDTSLDAPQVRAGIEKRWGKGTPIANALEHPKPEGRISLQNHTNEAWFRNIRIRPL